MILAAIALTLCAPVGERITCIHDGDSIVLERERIRIESIDTPELDGKCPQERAQAIAARDRLVTLLRPGFDVQRTGRDRYGRTLARLTVNGRDVGAVLVAEGYARPYDGGRKPWC